MLCPEDSVNYWPIDYCIGRGQKNNFYRKAAKDAKLKDGRQEIDFSEAGQRPVEI